MNTPSDTSFDVNSFNTRALIASAQVSIDDPARHVRILGKHFASKVEVKVMQHSTLIIFEEGSCNMIPHQSQIEFHCHADNRDDMKAITDTIDRHINAFFRKSNIDIDWQVQNNKARQGFR